MFDKNTYNKIKEFWGEYIRPFLVSFFHGLFWPFTWLDTKAKVWAELEASIGEKPDVCWP